jgi:glycosyltransferase involved in cell wall biosynthesis
MAPAHFSAGGAEKKPPAPRVLMITSRADVGGCSEHLHQLLKSLGNRYEMYVACPQEPPYWDRYLALVGADHMMAIPRRSIDPLTLWALRRYARRHRIRIAHSHGYGAGLLSRMLPWPAGITTVHTHHGVHFLWQRNALSAVRRAVEKVLARRAAATLFVSHDELQAAHDAGIAPRGTIVIPNGIDLDRLPAPRQAARESSPRLRIVNVNQFNACKNPLGLLAILAALRERLGEQSTHGMPLLDVYGDGEDRPLFERRVAQLGLGDCVRICGKVPRLLDRLPDYDLMLSCSHWEGLPLAVLEAMGCGLPVVLSRVPGHNELLRQGMQDMGFDNTDPGQAATLLMRLSDAALRERVGAQARRLVLQQYGQDTMLRKVDACYGELIAEKFAGMESEAAA